MIPLSHAASFEHRLECHGPKVWSSVGQGRVKAERLTHSSDSTANRLPRPRYSARVSFVSLAIPTSETVDEAELTTDFCFVMSVLLRVLISAFNLAAWIWSRCQVMSARYICRAER